MALRIAVLISGGGSTLANLITRIEDGRLRGVEIARVIASRRAIMGVEIARAARLDCDIIRPGGFSGAVGFSYAVAAALRESHADLAVMGGYLVRLQIPAGFERRVLNIHPALLPAFGGAGMYGRRVHEAVLRSGASESGCTVHLADDVYDHGPIIAQARTPVYPDDTPETLAARVGGLEHDLYPKVIAQVAEHGVGWLDRPEAWPASVAPPAEALSPRDPGRTW